MTNWTAGVNEYFRSNYTASANAFSLAGAEYSFNRWATPLQKLAESGIGSPVDTSTMNQLQATMIVVLIVLVVLTVLLTIAFFVHRSRINRLLVGHYGTGDPIQTMVTPQPQPLQPQQPVEAPTALPPIQTSAPTPVAEPPVAAPASSVESYGASHTGDTPSAPSAAAPSDFSNDSQELEISHETHPQTPVESAPETPKPEGSQSGPVEDPFYK